MRLLRSLDPFGCAQGKLSLGMTKDGMGPKALGILRDALAARGQSLKGEDPTS